MTMTEPMSGEAWTTPATPPEPMFEFVVGYLTAAKVADWVDNPNKLDNGQYECRVCLKRMSPAGYGSHSRSHLAVVGLTAPRKNAAKKTTAKAPKPPKAVEKLSAEDACIAMLMGMTGRKTIPIDKLPAVAAWFDHTKQLMEDL